MKNHVIVCGYGRVGESAVSSLAGGSREVVVVEQNPEKAALLEERGLLYIIGDATLDEVLLQAQVENASGLIVSMGHDSLNSFVVLSARALNESLHIVARSVDAINERKMLLAGANRVVSPYRIGGQHMANIMVRPQVTDFFDVVTLDGGIELWVEEQVISEQSSLVGKTVGEADIRRQTGVTVIAVYSQAERRAVMPRASTVLQTGDEMIVLGTRQQLTAMQQLAENKDGRQP
jgi:voltage-gated potassium channel